MKRKNPIRDALNRLLFLLAAIILAIFQATILDYLKIFGVKPDLLLIVAVLASLAFEFRWAFALSVFAGFLKDAFGVSHFGINMFLFGLWSFLILRLSREVTLDNNIVRAGLIFIIALLHNLVIALYFIYSGNQIPVGILLRIVFLTPLYTVAVLPLLLWIEARALIF